MTTSFFDTDRRGSASATHMAAQLIGPLAAGTRESIVAVDASGTVTVEQTTREALVLIRLIRSLDATACRISATLPGAAGPVPVADFAAWSESGATLPIYRPLPPAGGTSVAPFSFTLAMTEVSAGGQETAVPPDQIGSRVTAVLLEGVLGRLLFALGSEKARIRRVARELAAMRSLAHARDHALDSYGADLGVSRFDHRLVFDPRTDALTLIPEREPDGEYRQRLRIYRPFLQPSRRGVLERLNGSGASTDPNRGLPSGTGVASRFAIREEPNDIAVAISLVATGGDQVRLQFLQYIRAVHLVMPGSPVPAERFVPADARKREDDLRARLAQGFTWPADAAIAPGLAAALDRLARCRAALGENAAWAVKRAQDPAAGSRYELGIGIDLAAPAGAELDRMEQRLRGPGPVAGTSAEITALLAGLAPRPAADDPEGRWLFSGCGLRTVHRLATGDLHLSHFPTSGMVITPLSPGAAGPLEFEVRHHAPGDPGSNAVLLEGMSSASEAWIAGGHDAWTNIPPAAAPTRWAEAVPVAPGTPAETALRSAGLPALERPDSVTRQLGLLPPELLQTIELPDPLGQGLMANGANASNELGLLLQTLREAGLSSALALPTSTGKVLLVVGVIGLPQVGVNLGARRATGFRWYAVRLQPATGAAGVLTPVGSRTRFAPAGPGLVALVVLGYTRGGGTDPYESRVELPTGSVIDLRQYEYLMNLLDHVHPAGVEINTFRIRTGHVDLDGDGTADPLPPRFANHYREFRRPRAAGNLGSVEP